MHPTLFHPIGIACGTGIVLTLLTHHALRQWATARVRRAEQAWREGREDRQIVAILGASVRMQGELGFRARSLASLAYWAMGQREQGWALSQGAEEARFSSVQRLSLKVGLRGRATPKALHQTFQLGLEALRPGPSLSEVEGWTLLSEVAASAADFPMLLETLMLRGLARIQEARSGQVALGPQPWSPLAPFVFETSLRQLLTRHGDPRFPWDRLKPTAHLLAEGRPREAWAVLRTRSQAVSSPRAKELEIACLVALGAFQEAWMILGPALEAHPTSFRLWMERFRIAMTRRDHSAAREALTLARCLLPPDSDSELRHEWHLRKAEFSHWAEGNAQDAWHHFEHLPTAYQDQNPRLLLEIQLELGQFDKALSRVRSLQERNPTPELLLMEAKCLAGLEAWEAVLHRLEHPPDAALRDPQLWLLRGRANWHQGDLATARVELEIAVRLDPQNLDAVLDASQVCLDLGDTAGAEFHARRALELDPRGREGFLHLAEARMALHDAEGAKRLLRECLLHHPEFREAQSFLAELEAN